MKFGCWVLKESCPFLDEFVFFLGGFFEYRLYLREGFLGFWQRDWDEVAVFYFENHSGQELSVVDVRLVILDSCFPDFWLFSVSHGIFISRIVFGDYVSDCALGFSSDG